MKYRPAFDAATRSSSGATIRQGPHQGAQKSTTTGRAAPRTSASKATALGASIGSFGGARTVPQLPHFASFAVNGTRFFLPQEGQATITPRSSIERAMDLRIPLPPEGGSHAHLPGGGHTDLNSWLPAF